MWGQKLGHLAKSAENLVNTLAVTFFIIMNLAQNVCLDEFQVMFETWGQKLGHQAKSKENLVNTLAVTFLKQSSWSLLKMFVLLSSRSSLKLGHFG